MRFNVMRIFATCVVLFGLWYVSAPSTCAASIRGTVLAPNADEPVEGALVILSSDNAAVRRTGTLPQVVTTNKDGRFSFQDLPAGDYTLCAIGKPNLKATATIRLSTPRARIGATLQLHPLKQDDSRKAILWGIVRNAQGIPVPNATCFAATLFASSAFWILGGVRVDQPSEFTICTNADEFGIFRFDVAPRSYNLTAFAPVVTAPAERMIFVVRRMPHKTVNVVSPFTFVELHVVKFKSLILQLLNEGGQPLRAAAIGVTVFWVTDGWVREYSIFGTTDDAGKFNVSLPGDVTTAPRANYPIEKFMACALKQCIGACVLAPTGSVSTFGLLNERGETLHTEHGKITVEDSAGGKICAMFAEFKDVAPGSYVVRVTVQYGDKRAAARVTVRVKK